MGRTSLAAALAGALLGACAGPSGPATPVPSPTASSRTAADWPTYHGSNSRAGASAAGLGTPRVAWTSTALDGDVYASPIVAGGRVIVATENNTLYALDPAGGRVAWSAHLGEPMDSNAVSRSCGNIRPVVGITGTPVADTRTHLVYAVAFLRASGRHELFSVELETGKVRSQRAVDAPGADPLVHQQRGALLLGSGYVYVPYGGLIGDCGPYHGVLVGAPASGQGDNLAYTVPCGRACGLWAPSGAAADAAGDVYVATGNSDSATVYDYANSVLKLSPGLRLLDSFAPAEWLSMNRSDADLGSTGPLLLDGGHVFIVGKTGVGYLLAADHLGGVGGQAFAAPVCSAAFGGVASAAGSVYVPCLTGLVALRVQGSGFSVSWRSAAFAAGPPIVSGAVVWSLDAGTGVLHEAAAADGRELAALKLAPAEHFTTLAASAGRVFVATGRTVSAVDGGA